jgi:hypothetical protein
VKDKVECHAGYKYPEYPVAFTYQEERIEIEEIIARWRIPNGERFRIRTVEQTFFEITYSEAKDEWQIHQL